MIRKATCTLGLKGSVQRELQVKTGPKGQTGVKHITEQFDYELPGTLEEEVDPKGTVRFRFTPSAELRGNPAAKVRLHLSDDSPAPGMPPVTVDASEISNASPFVFEARGRGQGLIPVSGQLDLRGRINQGTPLANPLPKGSDVRPVLSMPLPSLKDQVGKPGTPIIIFQGIAPWAWANTSGPLTVSGNLNYAGPTGAGKATGSVAVTFRIGATSK